MFGGKEAVDLLSAARNSFGIKKPFWVQVKRFYGRIKVEKKIKTETAKEYFNPNNATLVLVGDFRSAEIVGIVNRIFGGIENKSSVPIDPEFLINNKPYVLLDNPDEDITIFYGQVTVCNINIPSFRDDDMIVLEHVINLLRYDQALGGQYSQKYLNKLGMFSFSHIKPSIGPSEISFIAGNLFSRKKDKRLKKTIKKLI